MQNPAPTRPLRKIARAFVMLALGMLLLFSTSCSGMVINMTKPVMIKLLVNPAFDVFLLEEDLELAHQAIGGQLKLVEILVKSIKRAELQLLLCQGFTSYGLLMEPKLNRMKSASQAAKNAQEKQKIDAAIQKLQVRIRTFALRGRKHCFFVLNQRFPGFIKSAELGKDEYINKLKKMSKADVPYLFWAGFGWGYAILNGMTETTLIAQIPQLKALMKRVVELDSSFFYGSGHLFLATLYSQSPTLGGNIKKAKEHFDLAYKHSDKKVLLVQYYQARFYSQQVGDSGEKLCRSLLKEINGSSKRIHPKVPMVNVLAKELASIAQKDADEFCP